MKKRSKLLALSCFLSLMLLAGCGNNAETAASGSQKSDNVPNASITPMAATEMGIVTAVDGNKITYTVNSQMGGMAPNGQGGAQPSMPDGQGGMDPNGQGGFDPNSQSGMTGETKTLTVSDTSILYKIENNVEVQAALSDITVGAMLQITYGDSSEITKIVIGSGSSPDGTAPNGNGEPSSSTIS